MTRPPFRRVAVDREVLETPFARELLGRLPADLPVAVREPGEPAPRGRATLHVTREPGAFVKPCPCSPGQVRCGYQVLTLGFQCPYACSYCFLGFYAPDEPLTVYANLEDAAHQFRAAARGWAGPTRLGTGEFADSLALDPWTGHARWLRDLVAPHPSVILELKTKSVEVEAVAAVGPLPNLVVAWSVNPPERIAADEAGTPGLDARLAAAARLATLGHRVAFHFDPVVLEEGWEAAYGAVARRLFEAVDPARVAWVSLGTLRFPPRFLEQWGARLQGRRAFFGELLPGEDGKLRYFWPLRRAAYRHLAAELRRWGGDGLRIYLCMESPAMWGAALGHEPTEAEVAAALSRGA